MDYVMDYVVYREFSVAFTVHLQHAWHGVYRRFPCIADMHGMYFIVSNRGYVQSYRGVRHLLYSSIRHGVLLLRGILQLLNGVLLLRRLPTIWNTSTLHGFVYIVLSSSSRRGIALWASAADAHLICPVPD